MDPFLIIGLGNPGKNYTLTRHNAGFLSIDKIHTIYKDTFSDFKTNKKCNALISKGKIKNKNIILAKPICFMNESGKIIKNLSLYFKIKPEKIIIIHDDKDLNFEKIKISFDSSSAGHKGIDSIILFLKTKKFHRIRIGISNNSLEKTPTEKFVLQNFTKDELNVLDNNIFNEIIKSIFKITL